MPDPREYARAALAQTDEALSADCVWNRVERTGRPPQLQLVHQPTGLRVAVDLRATEAETRFIALLHLRNRCYDMIRTRGKR